MTPGGKLGGSEDESLRLRRDIGRLKMQVEQLQQLMARTAAAITAAILCLGLLLPLATDSHGHLRILTAGFQVTDSEQPSGEEVLLIVGFHGLAVVVILTMITVLVQVAGGNGGERSWFRGTVLSLAIIGTLIANLLVTSALTDESRSTSMGWGGLVLLGGLGLATWILYSRKWRSTWMR
ncbi:MAG: hypothetical protein ACK5KU_12015 [Beutenbergiaceae bacterium]